MMFQQSLQKPPRQTYYSSTQYSLTDIMKLLFVILVLFCGTTLGKECNLRCGASPWHIAGRCDRNTGRCLCYYGWTGPNSRFRPGTLNIIEADYCTEACHYTHDYK